ncbi:MAG: dihydroorotase [Candidatus Hydrogenedentota bacterium]|nr:MAG: dihydroorotase [Candidatus Hydrogenedentota bacterium]
MKILIKNGRVIDPASGTDVIMDVLIERSVIAKMGKNISSPKAKRIDANGLVVAPGFIDMHTHLREPGREDEETIETGSRGGVKGGFCALVPMANTDPVVDNVEVINFLKAQAEKSGWTHIYPVGAVTRGLEGKVITEIGEFKEAGAVAISDDGRPIADSKVVSVALECASMFGLPIISHCEDPYLTEGGCMNEGPTSRALGLPGLPSAAEEIMVARDIALARLTGGRVHIAHASCARSVELVRNAKREGLAVTAETAPHYFSLTDDAVKAYDTNAKMNPPLRTADDVEAIKEGLRDGTIDAIATDHAPHTAHEKGVAFVDAPFGIVGLETCLPLVMTKLVGEGVLTLSEAVSKLTVGPARILNLPTGKIEVGARADITVFDPSCESVVNADAFECKCRNSPFDGWHLRGRAVHVIVGGRLRLHDGRLVG